MLHVFQQNGPWYGRPLELRVHWSESLHLSRSKIQSLDPWSCALTDLVVGCRRRRRKCQNSWLVLLWRDEILKQYEINNYIINQPINRPTNQPIAIQRKTASAFSKRVDKAGTSTSCSVWIRTTAGPHFWTARLMKFSLTWRWPVPCVRLSGFTMPWGGCIKVPDKGSVDTGPDCMELSRIFSPTERRDLCGGSLESTFKLALLRWPGAK